MDIEKIVNESKALSQRVHKLEKPRDPCALVTVLCVNAGSLAETVIILEHKARAVLLNGPRYFLMDQVSRAHVSQDITSVGNLQMRSMATVQIALRQLLGGV
jgi:hypothetical protein